MQTISGEILGAHAVLSPGQRFRTNTVLFPPLWAEDKTEVLSDLNLLHGAVLCLAGIIEDKMHVLGSAFLIGPGIALTALHVWEEYTKICVSDPTKIGLSAIGIRPQGIQVWRVDQITQPHGTDICIILMSLISAPLDPIEIEYLVLTARVPRVGDRVMVAGCRSCDKDGIADFSDRTPNIALTHLVGTGRIVDVWMQGRDKYLMPQPCFAADLNTIGGMSGGPVFDERGFVIGLLSMSAQGTGLERGVSTFTAIAHGFMQKVIGLWPPGFWPSEEKYLLEIIEVDEHWRVQLSEDEKKWTLIVDDAVA